MQHQQSICDGCGLREVVSGEQNGSLLACQSADGGPEVRCGAGIHTACRFVEQEHVGALDEGARDSQPLLHAAGKFHDQGVGLLFETGVGKNFRYSLSPLAARNFIQRGKEVEVLASRKTRKE